MSDTGTLSILPADYGQRVNALFQDSEVSESNATADGEATSETEESSGDSEDVIQEIDYDIDIVSSTPTGLTQAKEATRNTDLQRSFGEIDNETNTTSTTIAEGIVKVIELNPPKSTVAELRLLCRSHGLSGKGKRAELLERLRTFECTDDI
jgi:hypothetical protein